MIALDVGYGQLHPSAARRPRVTVLERVNARHLPELPYAPELVTCDVSFISLRTALPPALAAAAPRWQALPLREAAVRGGPGGSEARRRPRPRRSRARAARRSQASLGWNARVAGVVDSGLPGPKGNREFFLHLVHDEQPSLPDELDAWIAAAVG